MELIANSSNSMNFALNPNHATIFFKCKYHTKYGQHLQIVGNIEELGCWDPMRSMKMMTNKDIYPTWESTIEITGPVGMEIVYKYVVYDEEKNCYCWEELKEAVNRKFTIASSGIFILNDEESTTNCYVQKILNNINPDSFDFDNKSYSNNTDENIDDPDKFNCLAYDANQLNSSEKPFFFCMNQKISQDDRIIIASAHLPFEIDRTPDDNFVIRVTDESLIYSILYGIKEKGICDVTWVGMLKNFSQFNEKELEKIKDFLRDKNIYMINVSETEYKNYWIYMNKILGDVFVASTVDIHK